MTAPCMNAMRQTTDSRRQSPSFMTTATMISIWSPLHLSHPVCLQEACFHPSSRRKRTSHLPFPQAIEQAHTLQVTTLTRLPETIRNDLALAVSLTARQLHVPSNLGARQTFLLPHSRILTRAVSSTGIQLLTRLRVKPAATLIIHLASTAFQNLPTALLLLDLIIRQRKSTRVSNAHLPSQTRLSGRMHLILSQQLRRRALLMTPMRPHLTILVSLDQNQSCQSYRLTLEPHRV